MRMNLLPVLLIVLVSVACSSLPPVPHDPTISPRLDVLASPSRLGTLRSESEIEAYVRRVQALRRVLQAHEERERERRWRAEFGEFDVMPVVTTGAPAMLAASTTAIAFDSAALASYGVSDLSDVASLAPNLEISGVDSITNNQEIGVDEGDIVKRAGDFLIVLRRGRLYSMDIGSEPGTPIRFADRQNVFPYLFAHDAWYDELLIAGNRLIVLGYSYETDMTELALFEIDRRGRIDHLESYAIRSNDYYSWDNYGSRLVDGKLVFYTPIDLDRVDSQERLVWPAYAAYGRTGLGSHWSPLVQSMEIVRSTQEGWPTILHAVVECDVSSDGLACEARGLIGEWEATHYVSRKATYLWVRGARAAFDPMGMTPEEYARLLESREYEHRESIRESDSAMLYRLPFDGSPIGAISVEGEPMNQFSFRELGGELDLLLVRSPHEETETKRMEWVRIQLARFEESDATVREDEVRSLPFASGGWWCRAHRFIGAYLLYASCADPDPVDPRHGVYAIHQDSYRTADWIETANPVQRIERVGGNALLVGSSPFEPSRRHGLDLTALLLSDDVVRVPSLFLPRLVETENRSHAFNFTIRENDTLMGLPAAYMDPKNLETDARYGHSWIETEPRNLISYFTMESDGYLEEVGRVVEASVLEVEPEGCEMSCFDWYGSLRPIFIGDRIFGLLGNEIIEAEFRAGRIQEVQRASLIAQ